MTKRLPHAPGKGGNQVRILDQQGRTTEELCDLIIQGVSLRAIATGWKVSHVSLLQWIADDDERHAATIVARDAAGALWDQKAIEVLEALRADSTVAEIARARELASHYRWRASKTAATYSDKSKLSIDATVTTKAKPMNDAEMLAEISALTQAMDGRYQLVEVVDEDEEGAEED